MCLNTAHRHKVVDVANKKDDKCISGMYPLQSYGDVHPDCLRHNHVCGTCI